MDGNSDGDGDGDAFAALEAEARSLLAAGESEELFAAKQTLTRRLEGACSRVAAPAPPALTHA